MPVGGETSPNPPTFCFERISVHPATRRSAIILKTKIAETRARIQIPDVKILE
jgi:hypothetical protein